MTPTGRADFVKVVAVYAKFAPMDKLNMVMLLDAIINPEEDELCNANNCRGYRCANRALKDSRFCYSHINSAPNNFHLNLLKQ